MPFVIRPDTTTGNAEGGFFLNKKDMASTFGYALPINFGLYFNNSNKDFNRVNSNDTLHTVGGTHTASTDKGSRLDLFFGGFGDSANLAFRFGYNHVRRNATSTTAAAVADASVVDFALGGTYQGFDFWGKAALEPNSDNTTFKSNSLSEAYQLGVRKEYAGFRIYAEYNEGREETLFGRVLSVRDHATKDNDSSSFELGVARVHKVKDSGEFFWDARLAWVDVDQTIANHVPSGHDINATPVKGYAFHMTAGLSHKLFSWLQVVGSLEADLFQDLDKRLDGDISDGKANLGFSVQSGGFQLDLNSAYDMDGATSDLLSLLGSSSGTISYNF